MHIVAAVDSFEYVFRVRSAQERVQADISIRGFASGKLASFIDKKQEDWFVPTKTNFHLAISFDSIGRDYPTPTEMLYGGVPGDRIGECRIKKNCNSCDIATIIVSASVTLPMTQFEMVMSMRQHVFSVEIEFCRSKDDEDGIFARNIESDDCSVYYVNGVMIGKYNGTPDKVRDLLALLL
jgi:hypothetical protein